MKGSRGVKSYAEIVRAPMLGRNQPFAQHFTRRFSGCGKVLSGGISLVPLNSKSRIIGFNILLSFFNVENRYMTRCYSRSDEQTWGSRVRALASHQCGPGSIPGLGVICGLQLGLSLVLVLASRGFSPGTPVFPLLKKSTFPNSNSIWTECPNAVKRI